MGTSPILIANFNLGIHYPEMLVSKLENWIYKLVYLALQVIMSQGKIPVKFRGF